TISNEYYIFTPVMGETIISITGIASSFSDGSDVYYKIIPRTASDIEAGGNRPPTISNVAIEPETPTDDDDITVSATVIDDTGIKSAYVYYGVDDNTTPDSASMSNSGSLYSATISALGSAGWFYYKVGATDDSNSTSTSSLDSVEVTGITNMADIQDNPSEWEGVTVTCQGVVTMGIDVIQTGLLNAYFQDNSGRGLNLFSFNQDPDYVAYVKRGFELIATGTITVYQGRTELENPVITFVDSNVTMPAPQILTTGQAASQNWDGTLVLVTGTILSVGAPSGGGSNVLIDDGSGEATIRIWETTGINTDDITVGETYNIKGIGGDYNGDKQIVPGYDEDIIPGEYIPGGVGVATISPTSVEADQSDLVETVTITADSAVTLDVIKIVIPSSWEWENPTASGVEYYGNGIDSSNVTVTIESNSIRLNGAAITNAASGIIRIKDLKSPVSPGTYTFQVLTSYDSNPLEEIALSPRVSVQGATKAFVQIPAKVLLPDFGEKIPITYAAPVNSDILIQVYDIEGTLIATLTDEEYDPVRSEVTWDGRDRHNEIVPIGVYICYVEATEKPSGRITTDKAPIVVAVPLN
ncbi:MAG: hypothetical protein GY855_17070, partial [candidate division Zixibacteria bacterium]|nr:hypothetical protein [candidate division Zixibacteria bacterium]